LWFDYCLYSFVRKRKEIEKSPGKKELAEAQIMDVIMHGSPKNKKGKKARKKKK